MGKNVHQSGCKEIDLEAEDVEYYPGPNSDPPEIIRQYLSEEVCNRYDVYSYRHAAAILATSFPNELWQLEQALLGFRLTFEDIGMPGGNESRIPKKISEFLRPFGWFESRIQGDLNVRVTHKHEDEDDRHGEFLGTEIIINNFIDGHKIDYVKGRVAFDLEWNSKDQTFDRDLYAFRAFHDCGIISAAVMLTRGASLNKVFAKVPALDKSGKQTGKSVKSKYGASTTWMGKLLYRLNAGRHGSCPVLVFGITPKVVEGWNDDY